MSRHQSPADVARQSIDDVDRARVRLRGRIPAPEPLRFPPGWKLSTSWTRAQRESAVVAPTGPAEFRVLLDDGANAHRCIFCILDGDLVAECDCKGFEFGNGWCAHVATLWWHWVRDRLGVVDLDTGRTYPVPPTWLRVTDLEASEPQHKRAAADGGIPR